MRINLTKKEIVNSIYMQIGYSKKVSENLLEDFFDIIFSNLKKSNKVKIAKFVILSSDIVPIKFAGFIPVIELIIFIL